MKCLKRSYSFYLANIKIQIFKQVLSKYDHGLHHPGKEKNQCHGHGQHFGYKCQGHFINGGRRLKNADQQTHRQTGQQHRRCQTDGRLYGIKKEPGYKFWSHNLSILSLIRNVASCGLRVTGCELRVARYGLQLATRNS